MDGTDDIGAAQARELQIWFQFTTLHQPGVIASCQAAKAACKLQDVFTAIHVKRSPKYALVLLRQLFGDIDACRAYLAQYEAELTALFAEVEASIPAEPEVQEAVA